MDIGDGVTIGDRSVAIGRGVDAGTRCPSPRWNGRFSRMVSLPRVVLEVSRRDREREREGEKVRAVYLEWSIVETKGLRGRFRFGTLGDSGIIPPLTRARRCCSGAQGESADDTDLDLSSSEQSRESTTVK